MSSVILSSSCFVCTSCEDMFTAENHLVTTDLAPQDTVFHTMGIVKRMQKLATRTILLGEVRADLVTVNPDVASADVQQLGNNEVALDNAYNKPADYYDVINNCNIYLAHVDSTIKTHGKYMYEREICAAKTFRAWCYLELAKIYGAVPFVTEPILSSETSEEIIASGKKADITEILNYFIKDLDAYADKDYNDGLRPKYGKVDYEKLTFDNFFIPARVLLAEMHLWRGSYTGNRQDYLDAIGLYHDYFCFKNEERPVRNYLVEWSDKRGNSMSTSYMNSFSSGSSDYAMVIPCDTVEYYGTTNDLRKIFCSQYSNNYYPWVNMSQRIKDISAGQDYCYYYYYSSSLRDTVYYSKDPNEYEKWGSSASLLVGDLRLYDVYYSTSNKETRRYHSEVNDVREFISKWTGGSSSLKDDKKSFYVPLYRNTILYLHMAEALNRAGFPETAFAVLSRGLTYDVMNNRNIISQREFDGLCEIKSRGLTLQENNYDEKSEIFTKTRNSFVIWPSNVFQNYNKLSPRVEGAFTVPSKESGMMTQIGVHSRGCGDTEVNEKYYLDDAATKEGLVAVPAKPAVVPIPKQPGALLEYTDWLIATGCVDKDGKPVDNRTNSMRYDNYKVLNADSVNRCAEYPALYDQYQKDSSAYEEAVETNVKYLAKDEIVRKRQARVAKLILDEEALEGCFEGYRFYDIMRYQMQEASEGREGFNPNAITLPKYITEQYPTFKGATPWKDNMTGKSWYLPLPKR